MRKYNFEKLDVWSLGVEITKDIYELSADWPSEEKFGIIRQIRRAALSVPTNIAEGTSRSSIKDRARFVQISYGSLLEVLNLLIIAKELNYVDDSIYLRLREKIERLSNMMNSYKKSLERIAK